MASLNVVVGIVGGDAASTTAMPILNDTAAETLTIDGVVRTTTITAPFTGYGQTCAAAQVTATGSACWVARGPNPTPTAGSSYLVLDGQTRDIYMKADDRIAVVEATGL